MKNIPVVHLVCGSTGAGKTTYSIKLAAEKNALRFSIDPWMQTLFWKDAPKTPDVNWALERVARCEEMIWSMCLQVKDLHLDVVLDLGFSKKEQRELFYVLAHKAGLPTNLHYLDVPRDTRLKRVLDRNKQKNETYSFEVNQAMFDYMETVFEAPGAEELALGRAVPNL
jgi:predicted kinase